MAVLTVSRDLGSGGVEVGREVVRNLGYDCLEYETILERVKKAGHKWEKISRGLDEHMPRIWEKFDWSYRGFVAIVQCTILNEAAKDRVVIMGRGANYLLQDIPFVLRVRLVAPLEKRIARVAQRDGIDEESARYVIERTDREREGFLHSIYGRDGTDPVDYDIVFDSDTISTEDMAATITSMLEQRDQLKSEAAVQNLKMRALASSIKSRLITALPFFLPTLEVVSAEGGIIVRAIVHLPRDREMVVKEALAAAGDTPLNFELRYRQ